MNKKSSYLRRVQLPRTPAEWLETVMNFIFFLCGMLAVGCVVLITVYMIISGVPAIRKIGLFKFLLGTEWASTAADPKFGILPFILSSIYGTLGATLIGVPVGLLTAVFLSKAADPKVRTVVVTAIELLAGIPSVVFGLLGMQVLVPAVAKAFGKASGACLLAAIVVLSIMILPSIVSVSVTALNAVPPEYEQGSLALGATDAETWFKVSVPAARSGIAAGIVLTRTEKGRHLAGKLGHRFRHFREIADCSDSCRFAGAMALALKSGLTPERGLEFSRNLIEDPFYLERIDQCCAEIEQGTEFSGALVKTKVFTGVYARMTAIAGKSGMMDEVMEQIADRCEEELREHITSFLAVLEPTLVIILSVIVGIILLSVMLPLLGIMAGL